MPTPQTRGPRAPFPAARLAGPALALALLSSGPPALAQAQSMEERLRAQLRTTTTQLQQAQNELAVLKAGGGRAAAAPAPVAAGELESLRKELAQSRNQLAGERAARQKRDGDVTELQQQAQAQLEKANAQAAQVRQAYDELLKMARAAEAERQRLAAEAAERRDVVQRCEAKNARLYAVGQDILRAYESMDMNTVLSARQPFAAQSRVRYEDIAQQFGDQLYAERFDARAAKPAPDAAAPAQP